ncbi:MAG: MFS transporter [Sphaerochaeta sp.]
MTLLSQYRGLRKDIYVLFFGRMVTSLGSMVWPLLTLVLSRKLGMKATQIALFTTASGLVYLPSAAIGGKLADRFSKKNVIVYCDIISIAFYVVCSFIPLSIYSIIMLTFAGAFQQLEYPAYNALIADLTLSKDRERAYSLAYLGMNMGLVAAPTIAGFLFENYVWLTFLTSGISIGLSTIMIFFLVKDTSPVEETDEAGVYQKSQEDVGLWKILRKNKLILLYVAIMMFYRSVYNQYSFLLPMDMGNLHGEKGATIYGSVLSLNSIVVVLFTPMLTKVFAKVPSTKKALTGHILLFAGYFTFLFFRGIIAAYYAAVFLFTLGEIMSTLVEGPYITQRIPISHRGRVNGFMTIAKGVMFAVLELSAGSLYDRKSPVAAWTLVLTVLAFSLALCVILVIMDKRCYPALYGRKEPSDLSQ